MPETTKGPCKTLAEGTHHLLSNDYGLTHHLFFLFFFNALTVEGHEMTVVTFHSIPAMLSI